MHIFITFFFSSCKCLKIYSHMPIYVNSYRKKLNVILYSMVMDTLELEECYLNKIYQLAFTLIMLHIRISLEHIQSFLRDLYTFA